VRQRRPMSLEQSSAERDQKRAELAAAVKARQSTKPRVVIEAKIEHLRNSPEMWGEFQDHVAAIKGDTPAHILDRNISSITDATPSSWAAQLTARAQLMRTKDGQRAMQAQSRCRELQLQRVQELETNKVNKQKARQEAIEAKATAAIAQRGAAWSTIVILISAGHFLGQKLVTERRSRALAGLRVEAVVRIYRKWKVHLLKKRVRQFLRAKRLVQRVVYFWRFRRRIQIKRRAVDKLVEVLRLSHRNRAQQFIRLYLSKVRTIQRFWKRTFCIITAEWEILGMQWKIAPGLQLSGQDRKIRMRVISDELLGRKTAHVQVIAAWHKAADEYKAALEEETTLVEARRLMTRPRRKNMGKLFAPPPPPRPPAGKDSDSDGNGSDDGGDGSSARQHQTVVQWGSAPKEVQLEPTEQAVINLDERGIFEPTRPRRYSLRLDGEDCRRLHQTFKLAVKKNKQQLDEAMKKRATERVARPAPAVNLAKQTTFNKPTVSSSQPATANYHNN